MHTFSPLLMTVIANITGHFLLCQRTKCKKTTHCHRLCLVSAAHCPSAAEVVEASPGTTALRVQFGDGSSHDFPSCWLRDNCQCDLCYDHKSFTRKLVLDDWDQDDYPVHVEVSSPYVYITKPYALPV